MSRYAQIAGGVVVAFLPGPPEQWVDLHAAGALVLAGDDVKLGWVLDGGTLTPPPPREAPVMSPLAFRERFSQEEREAITSAGFQDAKLRVWLDDLNGVSEVRLDSPKIAAGVAYLVASGLLPAERGAALLQWGDA